MRLNHKFLAPTHICYGNNNRSVMLRLPSGPFNRLEHRLPSSDACPFSITIATLWAIKEGINLGLELNYPKIYGNAFDPIYHLEPIL